MHKSEKLFYLWKLIEKTAFSPPRDKIIGWLHCYGQFLSNLWRIYDHPLFKVAPAHNKVGGSVDFSPLKLAYSFKFQFSPKKYDVYLKFKQCCLQFGYDSNYFNELDICEIKGGSSRQIKEALKDTSEEDIDKVLKGKVVHPAIHQHIIYENIPHNIRIGTSTRNPFLFLYQFAFQLCDCFQDFKESDIKKREFERLKKLFSDHIKNSEPKKRGLPIAPGKLFDL